MSMNGNPHYDDGRSAGVYYATRRLDAEADVIALAGVEATLALAYEQRTANLIAFEAQIPGNGIQDDSHRALYNNILSRLGLPDA